MKYSKHSDPVNAFFGLSYNHYLVVPRSLLQSMPREWQGRLTDLLEEMRETPGGKRFVRHHYLVRRTDPDRDADIHDADLRRSMNDDESTEVPEPIFLVDPFYDYRHPNRSLFKPVSEGSDEVEVKLVDPD